MNTSILKANWETARARLQHRFPNLTDADLEYHEGAEEDLIRRVERRTRRSREEILRYLADAAEAADHAAREEAQRRDFHEKRIDQARAAPRHAGAQRDESGQTGAERSAQRTTRPGDAGLANESRPGLGTRADEARDPAAPGSTTSRQAERSAETEASAISGQQARSAPEQGERRKPVPTPPLRRGDPQEPADPLTQEEERSTGMSGQSHGV